MNLTETLIVSSHFYVEKDHKVRWSSVEPRAISYFYISICDEMIIFVSSNMYL